MTLPTSAEGVTRSHRARSVGIGHSHAKAILLGEHAVVYGAPALALPIPQLTVTASAGWSTRTSDDQDDLSYTMTGSPSRAMVTQASDGLRRLTAEFMARTGVSGRPHIDVILDGAIPHGRGLGSSAASSRAIAFALADLFGRELSEDAAFDLVQTAENMAHGRASGVDARTVGAARPLLFQAGRTEELKLGCDGLFIVADSGELGSTREAVELLRNGFARRPGAQEAFVRRATELTEAARRDLAEGRPEELGARLTDFHALLRAAGLSTDGIEALVDAAHGAGSLGAKITGGGLGGCVIALARPEQAREVTRRLHEAGAVQTWVVPLKGFGNHAS
ncbi:mevalonate kinase [Streptomyces galbus]|uniref:mevalonate kinase n=1 Tax=Streptomyces galbus TaxID=33898 RepID=A0A4U5WU65_STRGB|nr:mevalonate kinase [Streptomyces galbus]TKT05949.1 mevalonate kinase [Streptomyces galbus]GHD54764.1 mevalonate kinase [Streptomyces galbus]